MRLVGRLFGMSIRVQIETYFIMIVKSNISQVSTTLLDHEVVQLVLSVFETATTTPIVKAEASAPIIYTPGWN